MKEGIQVSSLVKVYANGVKALKGLSFTTPSRGIVVLVGPNGAGKTTLIKILTTIVKPTSGVAYVKGYDVVRDVKRVREIVSLVPQEGEPDRYLTVWEHVYLYLRARGLSQNDARELAKNALEAVGLWDRRNVICARLSGGQRRRVLIATALAVPAEVYFLDEPTVGLDPIARRDVWDVLRQYAKERLIFLTTHYMEEAEQLGEKILLINEGNLIAEGSPAELIARLNYNYKVLVETNCKKLEDTFLNDNISVVRDNHNCILYVRDSLSLKKVLDALVRYGTFFSVQKVSLEDAFISLLRGVKQ